MTNFRDKNFSSEWFTDSFRERINSTNSIDNALELIKVRNSIANFAMIVTGMNHNVKFATDNQSYTDGKTIVIGRDVADPKNFDTAVGLTLHEASHIKLSDFEFLAKMTSRTQSLVGRKRYTEVVEKALVIGINDFLKEFKSVVNVIEDRRIDNFMYESAPGYQGYYLKMYDTYFNSQEVDDLLNSGYYIDESFESYMTRLISLHSKHSNLNALKGLREIYNMIDLKNISRLENFEDVVKLSFDVIEKMIEFSKTNESNTKDENQDNHEQQEGQSQGQGGEGQDGDGGDGEGQDGDGGDGEDGQDNSNSNTSSNGSGNGNKKLTKGNIKKALNDIKKQRDFVDGNIKKGKISDALNRTINEVKDAGIHEQSVELEESGGYVNKIKVIVVDKLTKSLLESKSFPLSSGYYDNIFKNKQMVKNGLTSGNMLGKRLQVRNESRETIFNRQRSGKVDKRMVHSLGYSNETVFYTKEVDRFKKANLHISLDASGSMDGNRWLNSIYLITSIAKAVDMIPNLEMQLSIRTTDGHNDSLPYVVLAYDSRVDKLKKLTEVLSVVSPGGYTPESLCYSAISNYIPNGTNDMDSYFLNISDGAPYYTNNGFGYHGRAAINHIKQNIKQFESRNIKILSYFISSYGKGDNKSSKNIIEDFNNSTSSDIRDFKNAYNKYAKPVDVDNINQIIKTLNDLFLQK